MQKKNKFVVYIRMNRNSLEFPERNEPHRTLFAKSGSSKKMDLAIIKYVKEID